MTTAIPAEYKTDEFWQELIRMALRVRGFIYTHDGMANKSAVEDVLMNIYPGLTRYLPHGVMNHIEYRGLRHDQCEYPVDEFRTYMTGSNFVDVKWWDNNSPF